MDKSNFRSEQIERLEEFFQTNQSIEESEVLLKKLSEYPAVTSAQKIGISLTDDLQIPTKNLISKLRELGKDIYLARPTSQNQLEFVLWPENSAIPESISKLQDFKTVTIDNSLDLIITPGIAFSTVGHYFIGVGVGNFDFFLNRYQTKTVGLAYSVMLFEKPLWDISMLDVPIDDIITVN